MADYISEIQLPNGSSYDIKDAEARAQLENIVTGVKGNSEGSYRTGNVNLTAANVGAVAKTGNETVAGNKTFSGTTSLTPESIYPVSMGTIIEPNSQALIQSPVPKYLWHDVLAFCRACTPTYYTTTDGTTWTEATLEKRLFGHMNAWGTTQVINSSISGSRWVWHGGGFAYSSIAWIVLGITYNATIAKWDLLLETTSDATSSSATWTTLCSVTDKQFNQKPIWIKTNAPSTDDFRLTITRSASDTSTTSVLPLCAIEFLTFRWGNQGKGEEFEHPYSWDATYSMSLLNGANLYPYANNSGSLGSSTKQWDHIYGKTHDVASNGAANNSTARHVWFSDSTTETRRAHSDSFKYTPTTNMVSANISGNAATATNAPTSATISDSGLITYKNVNNESLFTLQLPEQDNIRIDLSQHKILLLGDSYNHDYYDNDASDARGYGWGYHFVNDNGLGILTNVTGTYNGNSYSFKKTTNNNVVVVGQASGGFAKVPSSTNASFNGLLYHEVLTALSSLGYTDFDLIIVTSGWNDANVTNLSDVAAGVARFMCKIKGGTYGGTTYTALYPEAIVYSIQSQNNTVCSSDKVDKLKQLYITSNEYGAIATPFSYMWMADQRNDNYITNTIEEGRSMQNPDYVHMKNQGYKDFATLITRFITTDWDGSFPASATVSSRNYHGQVRFEQGLMIQYGRVELDSNGAATVTYTYPYTQLPFTIVNLSGSSTASVFDARSHNPTTTGFGIVGMRSNAAGSNTFSPRAAAAIPVNWLSIGI